MRREREMSEFACYVWGSQWWHWFLAAAVFVFLGVHSRTIPGRIAAIIGAVVTAWLGAALLSL